MPFPTDWYDVWGQQRPAVYTDSYLQWFVERRAFASSIIFGGACVGGAMLPFITDALLSSVGFSGSMRALSVISFVICSLGNLGIRPRVPPAPVASSARSSHRLPTINYRIFRTPLYVAVSLATALQAIGYYPVPFYIPSYAAALGLSSTDGTLALATFNLATLLGQVCGGTLCESLGYNVLMLASAVSSAAAVYIIWGFAHTSGLVYLFSVIFGAVSGVFTSSFASASADIAGRRNGQSASMVLASLGLWKGAAIVLGPIVSGVIHHSSKPIDPSKYSGYGFTGVILFVGSMLSATGLSVVVSVGTRYSEAIIVPKLQQFNPVDFAI
ncbi:major facilitator superfamily domain-containing protein [Cantharellus anzutake]|uniref:major facilitator superfamily domain-containing protein n=1 Tax=Cantharellus anzutake TaxID=1750568 RepID=UPI001908B71A|nr:major facilitator superfamily domain-containing protein [Cantharellus anzutake]KAF8342593.1 major facilitator superfamily domain-containing protein [Cantharellus anzutake]